VPLEKKNLAPTAEMVGVEDWAKTAATARRRRYRQLANIVPG